MKIDYGISKLITDLRTPLLAGVVFIHSTPNFNSLNIDSFFTWFFGLYGPSICVPCFFLISGFLIYSGDENAISYNEYISKIKKRFNSLILTYIIWNLLCFIVRFPTLPELHWRSIWRIFIVWNQVINNGFTELSSPIDGPLWYIRDLIGCVIISPIIYYALRRFSLVSILFLLLWWFSDIYPFIPGFSSVSICFFSIGIWLRTVSAKRMEQIRHFISIKTVLILIIIGLICTAINWMIKLGVLEYSILRTISYKLFILSAGLVVIYIIYYISRKNAMPVVINKIGQNNFIVFALHAILVGIISTVVRHIPYMKDAGLFVTLIIVGFITFFSSIFFAEILKRLSPTVYRYLNGGR